jgi:hypothetical protein
LSEKVVGAPIEVMYGNSEDNPRLHSHSGEVNTAVPMSVEGRVVLCLWLNPVTLDRSNFVIVTHEIGHWVLKLQGFRGLICKTKKHCHDEILLNSLVHHPPLYTLQRSLGHEPQIEIDSHANHDIQLLLQEREHLGAMKTRALYLADDLLNSSAEVQAQLRASMMERHPETLKLIEEIVKSAHEYNLLDHDENLGFAKRIVKRLALDGVWHEIDEVENLISMAKKSVPRVADGSDESIPKLKRGLRDSSS